jgi:NADPH-dependent ferric siderophore reductase
MTSTAPAVSQPPVVFQSVPLETELRPVALVGRDWLTPGYVRLRFAGESLRGFHAPGADDHVRLFLAPPGSPLPDSTEGWREFPSREYTPVAADAEAGWVEFDFVGHGEGIGSQWAAGAPLGSAAAIGGPRRSSAPSGEPDAWVLAGDETAVPAITRFLRARTPGTPARVILEVAPENRFVPLPGGPGIHVTVLTRDTDGLPAALAAQGESDRPRGAVLAFVAGEAAVVPAARALLLDRWGLPEAAVVAKGYWRR